MDILKYLFILFIFIFPVAEAGRLQFGSIAFSINDIVLFFTVSFWLVFNYKKINLKKYKLTKPIFIFSAVSFITLLFNPLQLEKTSFITSLLYLIRWILYSSVYFMLVSQDKQFLKKLSDLLLVPIAFFIGIGYIQFFFYESLKNLFYAGWDEHLYRLFSTFLDPNFAGAFLTISLIFLIHKFFESVKEKRNNKMVFIASLSLLNLLAVYLTYSRSALIMLFISLAVYFFLVKKLRPLVLLFVFLFLLIFISPKSFQTEGTNFLRIASGGARIQSAYIALDIIQKHPIFGVGFNAYRYAQNKYANLTDSKWEITHSGAGTDNSFLFVFATTGIAGFAVFLYLIYKIFLLGKEGFKKNSISKVLIAVFAGLLINSFFNNSLFYVYILEWIWILSSLTENS